MSLPEKKGHRGRWSHLGLSRRSLALALLAILALGGIATYLVTGVPVTSTSTIPGSSSSTSAGSQQQLPLLNVSLSPATPLIAPGQTQNYSLVQVQVSAGSAGGPILIRASAPPGISFLLNTTSISSGTQQSIPVVLRATENVQPGKYAVSLAFSLGSQTLANKTFSIQVVPALVVVFGLAFHPQNITVSKGTAVYWINLESNIGCCDPGNHNVVFLSGASASSPVLKRLDTWSYTFDSPASVQYYCSIHPSMKAQVTVTG